MYHYSDLFSNKTKFLTCHKVGQFWITAKNWRYTLQCLQITPMPYMWTKWKEGDVSDGSNPCMIILHLPWFISPFITRIPCLFLFTFYFIACSDFKHIFSLLLFYWPWVGHTRHLNEWVERDRRDYYLFPRVLATFILADCVWTNWTM